jgi:putative PIG3 family NAD(P)H quinone oxidoreductase
MPQEVLIEVQAAGLNRADLMQRMGMYPPPPGASEILGLEVAGVVATIGHEVTEWAVGDRVCALLAGGGYAEFAAVDKGSILPLPDHLTFAEGACLPEAMMTVWANAFLRCGLQPGESFLMHGGTSGIGVMGLQMAKLAGAGPIFATAGSQEKVNACLELGADVAINYHEEDFADVVEANGGADVIIDMVGGDYVQKNIVIAKPDGRICNIAYQDGFETSINFLPVLMKRLVVTATTLRARPNEAKQHIRNAILEDFWPAVIDGTIKPMLDTTFPFDEAAEAHEMLSAGGHIGKIVLVPDKT